MKRSLQLQSSPDRNQGGSQQPPSTSPPSESNHVAGAAAAASSGPPARQQGGKQLASLRRLIPASSSDATTTTTNRVPKRSNTQDSSDVTRRGNAVGCGGIFGGGGDNVDENGNPVGAAAGNCCNFPACGARSGSATPPPAAASASALSSNLFGASNAGGGYSADDNLHTMAAAEAQIAHEMNRLSVNERELIYEEIHGVAKEREEDEEYIVSHLKKLDVQIRKIRAKDRLAYDKAAFLNPSYVRSRKFLLMFLRSENFHPAKTAKRLVAHFEEKSRLFGSAVLPRHVYYSDLTEDDIRSIRHSSGAFFFKKAKDSVGRTVMTQMYAESMVEPDAIRHSRAFWYMIMATLEEDEETQRKGYTSVNYAHGATRKDFGNLFEAQKANVWVMTAVPMKLAAAHFCFEDNRLASLVSLLFRFMPTEMQLRTKMHFGSNLECQYALATFGVFNHRLPVNGNGRARPDLINFWIDDLKDREEVEREKARKELIGDRTDVVESPSDMDVLLGRGRPFMGHPGTLNMMKLVEAKKDEHAASRRAVKKTISEEIVRQIHDSGGRFLQRDEETDLWVIVDTAKAHEKVAQGFRNSRRAQPLQREQSTRSNFSSISASSSGISESAADAAMDGADMASDDVNK